MFVLDFDTILSSSIKKKFIRNLDEFKSRPDNEKELEVKTKIEIINILLFLMDIRQDEGITNIVSFIRDSINRLFNNKSTYAEEIIQKEIRDSAQNHLPTIFENGLPTINSFSNNSNKGAQFNHDFDKINEKPMLPLLLFLFQFSNDYDLSFLILNLIFKMFEQRRRIIKSLKDVHLIIGEADQKLFEYLQEKSLHLKFITEQSEIWLVSPNKFENPQFKYRFVIFQVRDTIKELIRLFYCNQIASDYFVNDENFKYKDEDISQARQIMMRNLRIHNIICSLLKDGLYAEKYFKN